MFSEGIERIERPRLLNFGEAGIPPLLTVTAPAGYGKSLLLQQWAASDMGRTHRFLTVRCHQDWDDGDPSARARAERELWTLISGALHPGKETSDPHSVLDLVRRLKTPTILIIDDYQNVSEAHLDLQLSELASASDRLWLVVSSRANSLLTGPLTYSKLRVGRIGAEDLAFTNEEIRQLAVAMEIDPVLVSPIVGSVTSGWPVAVSAMLQGISHGLTEAALINQFAALVRDQLRLIRNPMGADLLNYIIICGGAGVEELSDYVAAPASRVEEALSELMALGLISGQWGNTGIQYASSQPALEFLSRDAERELGPTRVQALRRDHHALTAAEDPDGALAALLDMKEYKAAEQVFLANFLAAIEPSPALIRAVERTPKAELQRHLPLSLLALIVGVGSQVSGLEVSDRILMQLRHVVAKQAAQGSKESAIVALATLAVALRMRGEAPEAMRVAREIGERLKQADRSELRGIENSLPVVHAIVGFVAVMNGDGELARRSYSDALELATELGLPAEQIRAWSGLSLIFAVAGKEHETREILDLVNRTIVATGTRGPAISEYSRLTARALLAVEDRTPEDLDALAQRIRSAKRGSEQIGILSYAEVQMKRITDGPEGALVLLEDRAQQVAAAPVGTTYMLAELAVLRANLLIYLGSFHGASRILSRLPERMRIVQMARARLSLFSDQPREALNQVEELLQLPLSQRLHDQAEAVAAVASWELSDLDSAQVHLRNLAESLNGDGGVNVLATVPYESMSEMVASMRTSNTVTLDGTLSRLLEGLQGHLEELPANLRALRVEPLSQAELRTLWALEVSSSREDLAKKLKLSPNTVKFHLRGIYRKLGVNSRAAALSRAAFLGLLDRRE